MSDNPVTVIDFLRTQFAQLNRRLDTSDRKLDEVITRLSALERDGAALKMDFAGMQHRLDNIDRRLAHMERWDAVAAAIPPMP